jgi:undecaprenyl pyrophosphate phosphatase UppP
MIKTSLSIVLAFILCLVLGVTAKEYIDYEIYVRFIIFFCIFFGLFVLYRDNIKKINI